MNDDWWEDMETIIEEESREEFIEREMSFADSQDIGTDEGGWGAWMGGEL